MNKLFFLLSIMLLLSCKFQVIQSKWTAKTAYTKIGFHYERDRHLTTNYIRGTYVPPNTEVKIITVSNKVALISINELEVSIENIERYTQLPMEGVLDRMLSPTPVKPKISAKFKTNAKTGQPSIGMTKDEVITCIGYPPAHATESTNQSIWTYWWSRFNTKELIFKGNILNRIRD